MNLTSILDSISAIPKLPLVIGILYLIMSIATWVVYGIDKKRAETGAWRVPEATLHLLELAFGWPGAWLAQRHFRHKTRKVSFQILFWLVVLIHAAVWSAWAYFRYKSQQS